jgi:sulfate adenylyltransferase
MSINPHGGTLTARLATPARAAELAREAASLPRLTLTPKQSCDLELLANGGYSPLDGFMGEKDFRSVCERMTLASGHVWSIPVLLAVAKDAAPKAGARVALHAPNGVLQGVVTVRETFAHDKKLEVPSVFRTEDPAHPGVAQVLAEGDTCIAGPVEAVTLCVDPEGPEAFIPQRLTPAQTRAAFAERGWKTIVAFQTRNPIHRAHEYVCKCAQEICDGLLIHPLVGETKKGDVPADVRMKSIGALVAKYFSPTATMVSVLPAAMRYAGPREAIHHAIMRKNYGVTHFIVGRDHAGVGNYYGTYDAQKIFDQIDMANLGLTILKFEHTGYSKSYGGMVSQKSYPKIEGDIINLSGTAVREMLGRGERPPVEFTRPEVADVLIAWARSQTGV